MKIKKGVPMKKIINNKAMLVALVIISTLAILSCGGGGGGDTPETNTALTAGNAPQAAAGVLKAMDIADALQGLSGLMTTTSSSTTAASAKSPINNIVNMTAAALQTGQQTTNSYTAGGSIPSWYSVSVDCSGGGTIDLSNASWDSPDDLTEDNFDEAVNFKGQVTFNSCKKSTLTLNGSVYVSVTGVLSSPSAATVSGSLTYNDTSNSTTLTLTNASVAVSNIAADFDMSNATILASGTLQATIDTENISLRCKNLTVQLASITGGTTATLSGQIRCSCLETWLTITTATPVTLMDGDTCPTGGDVSASYNGNTVRAVIAGSDTNNISLYFNGTQLTTTYSCTTLKGACGL